MSLARPASNSASSAKSPSGLFVTDSTSCKAMSFSWHPQARVLIASGRSEGLASETTHPRGEPESSPRASICGEHDAEPFRLRIHVAAPGALVGERPSPESARGDERYRRV